MSKRIKIKPSETRRVDPEKIAKALGAECVATLKGKTPKERELEGLYIYMQQRAKHLDST